MADETKFPRLQDQLAQTFLQLNTDINYASADAAMHVMALYEFLVRLGVAKRKDVHDYLRAQADGVDGSPRKAAIKRRLNAMADVFHDDAPEDPKARLQLIQGGLSEPGDR